MIAFWLMAALLVVTVVALLLPAALRKPAGSRSDDNHRALHAQRLAELKTDIEDRVLDPAEQAGSEDEITRALLDEAEVDAPLRAPAARWPTLVAIAIGVPAIALATYSQLGQPMLAGGDLAGPGAEAVDQESIDALLAGLEQRLVEAPDSAEGWLLLGRSYMALGRYGDAVKALERAHALLGDVPDVMLQYADALAMANEGRIGERGLELVERALALEPDNVAALWLAGIGSAEAGKRELALERLERARLLTAQSGGATAQLDAIIGSLGGAPAVTAPAAGTAAVTVEVTLDPALAASIRDSDVLFVFARAPGAGGPPLAVTRASVAELPRTFVLDETMAMAPQFRLRAGATVEITARVSRAGTPTAAPGDLEGRSGEVTVGQAATVALTISETIE